MSLMDEDLEFLEVEKEILAVKLEDLLTENEYLKNKCSHLELKLNLAAKDFNDDEVSSLKLSLIDVMKVMVEVHQSNKIIESGFKCLNDDHSDLRVHYGEILKQKQSWESKIDELKEKLSTMDQVYAELEDTKKMNEEINQKNAELETLVTELRSDIKDLERIIMIANEMERIRSKNEDEMLSEIANLKERALTLETSLNGTSETVDNYYTCLTVLKNRLQSEKTDEWTTSIVNEIEGIVNYTDSYVSKLENKKRIAHFNRLQKYKSAFYKVKDTENIDKAAIELKASRPFVADEFMEYCETGIKVFNTIKGLDNLSTLFIDSLVDRKNNILDVSKIASEPPSSIELFLHFSACTIDFVEFSKQTSIYRNLLLGSDVSTLRKVGNQLSSVKKIETILNSIIDLFLTDRLDLSSGTARYGNICTELQALRRLHFPDSSLSVTECFSYCMKGFLNLSGSYNDVIQAIKYAKEKISTQWEKFDELLETASTFSASVAKLKRCTKFGMSGCGNIQPTVEVNNTIEESFTFFVSCFLSLQEFISKLISDDIDKEEMKEKLENATIKNESVDEFLNEFSQSLAKLDELADRFGDGEFDVDEVENTCNESIFQSLESFARDCILKRKESNESAITSLLKANDTIQTLNATVEDMKDQIESADVKYLMLNNKYTNIIEEFTKKEEHYKQSISVLQDKTVNDNSKMLPQRTEVVGEDLADSENTKISGVTDSETVIDKDTAKYYISSIKRLTKENVRIRGSKLYDEMLIIERDFANRRSRNVLQGFKIPQKQLLELTREFTASECSKRIFDLTKSEDERNKFLLENNAIDDIDNLNKLSKLKEELDRLKNDCLYVDLSQPLEIEKLSKVATIIPKNGDADAPPVSVLISPDDLRILFSNIL